MVKAVKTKKPAQKHVSQMPLGPARAVVRDNLLALRQSRGLSQAQLGKLLGCSQNYVCEVETGMRKTHIDLVWALAGALGVAAHELLIPGRFRAS